MQGGTVFLTPGVFDWLCGQVVIAQAGIYIQGAGLGATTVRARGTGDCVRMYSTQDYTHGWGGGVKGLFIDGTNAGAGSCGIHAGDIYQLQWDAGAGFFQGSGSKGIWLDNQYFWAEDMSGHLFVQQNTTNLVFDNSANLSGQATGSFARASLTVVMDAKGVGDGLVLKNGAQYYGGGHLTLSGNMDYSSSATKHWAVTVAAPPVLSYTATNASPAVFTAAGHHYGNGTSVFLTGAPTGFTNGQAYFVVNTNIGGGTFQLSATSGGAAINSSSTGSGNVETFQATTLQSTVVNINVECNATNANPQPGTINFTSSGSATGFNTITRCTGIIDFSVASGFATAANPAGNFFFDGPVYGDTGLWRSWELGVSAYFNGSLASSSTIQSRGVTRSVVNTTTAITGMKFQSALSTDSQFLVVENNGTGSITFAAAGTSLVKNGTSCVILPNTAMGFQWRPDQGNWYPLGAPAAVDWLNVVTMFGADPTGTSDSTAAIQAAINAAAFVSASDSSSVLGAAQAAVYFPGPGPYLISSGPLVLTHGHSIRLTGAGDGVVLKSSANGIIDFDGLNGLTEGSVEIDHLGFDCTGGHVFKNPNIHGQLHLHDLAIRQRSTGFSVFWMDDVSTGGSTGLYQGVFRNIRYILDPGTRSVEAWHIVANHSDAVTDLTWENISGPVPTGYTGNDATMDNTQYQWYVTCAAGTSSHVSNLTWRNCIMSNPFGGIIKVAAAQSVLIENVSSYNTFDRSMSNSLYQLTKDPTGNGPVQGAVIRNCFRTNALGSGSPPPPYDVLLDSTCKNVLLENIVTGYSPAVTFINVGSAAGVVIIQPGGGGASSVPVISNQAADTVVIGQGQVTVGGASQTNQPWLPSDSGYLAWNFDPAQQQGGTILVTSNVYLARVNIRQAISVSNVLAYITTPGSGLTASQNFAGLYNSAGTLIATTADQSSGFASGGLRTMALTGGPYALAAGTFVWVAIVSNGTTPPTMLRGGATSASGLELGLTVSTARWATNGTATTALPGTLTPASNVNSGITFWAGLS